MLDAENWDENHPQLSSSVLLQVFIYSLEYLSYFIITHFWILCNLIWLTYNVILQLLWFGLELNLMKTVLHQLLLDRIYKV